ncbi:MAG TPA: arginine repressor [Thermoanaerobaculia bacterium]|jgi:transcriptional regulator of arginine metabolism|nr:arginine repressor [Thermoanaerobaculia bacterium]
MRRDSKQRRRVLQELISLTVVQNEAALLLGLRERGITVTQATVSRDLAALGASRVRTAAGLRYVLRNQESTVAVRELALLEITAIVANESIIVVKTRVGHASGVGVFLDSLDQSKILGTVAGNDTVIVIPDSHENLAYVLHFLRRLVYGDKIKTPRVSSTQHK